MLTKLVSNLSPLAMIELDNDCYQIIDGIRVSADYSTGGANRRSMLVINKTIYPSPAILDETSRRVFIRSNVMCVNGGYLVAEALDYLKLMQKLDRVIDAFAKEYCEWPKDDNSINGSKPVQYSNPLIRP